MSTLNILNQIVSVEEMVRNYRMIFDRVKETRKPMIVLRRNRPDIALIDVNLLQEIEEKLKKWEEQQLVGIVKEGREEFKQGKTRVLKSISSLMKNAD